MSARYTRVFVQFHLCITLAASLCLVACGGTNETFAPPPQRAPVQGIKLSPRILLDMGNAASSPKIVKDIDAGPPVTGWRWAGQDPTVRVRPLVSGNFRYHIEFAIAGQTFRDTGPVTVTFVVNDHVIGHMRCDLPGTRIFDAPVPAGLVHAMADNTVAAHVDKVWVSKLDNARLGMIVVRMGLTQ